MAADLVYQSLDFVMTSVLTCYRAIDYPCRMPSPAKSAHLQIRLSPAQKAAIQRAARRAGMEMSSYVLARVLPAHATRFQDLAAACREPEQAPFALAEINSWLAGLSTGELRDAVGSAPTGLTAYLANYIAAMVEYACAQRDLVPPQWTRLIAPLTEPVFGSALISLRLHLLSRSPAPFRRRNIFIDATIGDRV